jgi:hypothetical protein
MAMGGGVGLRQRKVTPPSRMAASSAPASAEFQCQRTGAVGLGEVLLPEGDTEGGVGGAGEVGMAI